MQTLSLYDLNEYIRRVIALNFNQPLWITAEIAEASLSKGHLYLSLVQQAAAGAMGNEGIVAQAQGIIWQRDRRKMFMAHGQLAEAALSPGAQARMLVRVDFHERYGLKLHIEDIDPAYSLGIMAMQRRQTIDMLRKEGLWDLNRALPLPAVIQRVAVITSPDAAGFHDFKTHLSQNMYGYRYETTCFFAAVQGKNAEPEICAALLQIAAQQQDFDVVTIIRGGGSRLDLSVFDARELCKTVAAMPVPVLTGVGHEIDESVLDMVAHTPLKTPTAVADFLVENNLRFESALLSTGAQILQFSGMQVQHAAELVEQLNTHCSFAAQRTITATDGILEKISSDLPRLSRQRVQSETNKLAHFEELATVFSPQNTLRRGYSLTVKNGKVVTSAGELQPGDQMTTRLSDGEIQSTVV